jgi:drug/metabolite transporter (DMT)-like permease
MTGLGIMAYPSPLGGPMIAGLLWGTLSGFAFAVLSLLNRQTVREFAPEVVAFYQNAVAAVLLLPMLVRADVHIGAGQIAMLALLGIVCTALSHALFIRGLTVVRAQLASVIACLEPVYGIVMAYFLLHELPSIHTLAGGTVILMTAAVAMFRRAAA